MSPRNELIRSIRRAITELKTRRMDPSTSPAERARLTAQIADLEAQLAQLTAARIAAAASGAALRRPDQATFDTMRSTARELDDAVAESKATSAIVALVNTGFTALEA
jgi:uncharacterized coiled-coil DUF342 family protein